MKHLCLPIALCAALAFSAASTSASPAALPTYDLQRGPSQTAPVFVWKVRAAPKNAHGAPAAPSAAFETLNAPALRRWVTHLSPRSIIRFYSVAMPMKPTDPPLRSDPTFWAQLKSFGEFCKAHHVSFQPELHSF